jgi:hypothetical protein
MSPSEKSIGLPIANTTSLEEWVAMGNDIYRSAERLTWHLADWAAFGERSFGQLGKFCETHGINYQTLRNHAYVAQNVQLSRRRDKLSFSHHCEVAPLPTREQDKWLLSAEREGWSVAELRRQIRKSLSSQSSTESDGPVFKFADKTALDLHHFLSTRPQTFWTDTSKQYWRRKLAPIVEFYEQTLI